MFRRNTACCALDEDADQQKLWYPAPSKNDEKIPLKPFLTHINFEFYLIFHYIRTFVWFQHNFVVLFLCTNHYVTEFILFHNIYGQNFNFFSMKYSRSVGCLLSLKSTNGSSLQIMSATLQINTRVKCLVVNRKSMCGIFDLLFLMRMCFVLLGIWIFWWVELTYPSSWGHNVSSCIIDNGEFNRFSKITYCGYWVYCMSTRRTRK